MIIFKLIAEMKGNFSYTGIATQGSSGLIEKIT